MTDIIISSDALRAAASELKNAGTDWMREAENITSEVSDGCREKMIYCGKIIDEYAALLSDICREYEFTEQEIMRTAGK